jgi:general secretion pathway protein J
MPGTDHNRGFTLLELLVAVAIFAIIAALAYGSLNALTAQRDQSDRVLDRLAELQRGIGILSRDFQQIRGRPVSGPYGGEPLPALLALDGEFAVQLTRGGVRNPLQRPRSTLERVAYRVEEDGLVRYRWPVLDQAQDSKPLRTVLLRDVERLELRFLAEDGQWVQDWPPPDTGAGLPLYDIPRAVEVGLDLADWGRITRLYPLGPNTIRSDADDRG